MTQNHQYNTPSEGTLNWDVPLNANFAALDTDVELRDVAANRTNYTPKDGAKFLATDTGTVYIGDGSSWNALGSLSGGGSGTGTTTTSGDVQDALASGLVVGVAKNLSAPQVVDPSSTATPVQDALDAVGSNGGGEVRLPPTTVSEGDTVRPYADTSIVGFGPNLSAISFGSGVDGIEFARGGISRVRLDGFALSGPGPSSNSGVAIHHTDGDTQDLYVGRLLFWGWANSVYRVDKGVGPFQCRHDLLTIYDCDAGDQDGLFEFRSWYGPANEFGTIAAYPSASASGKNSTVFFSRGGTQTVDYLTMGGSSGVAVDQTWAADLKFGNVHWEPTALQSTPPAIVRLAGNGTATIQSVKHVTGEADYAFELAYDSYNAASPGRKTLGPYVNSGSSAGLGSNIVNLSSPVDPSNPSFYRGAVDDVTVTHSQSGTGGLRVLGGAGTGLG
ncbi:MAG: hypothetical protein ABEJ70_03145 [Halobacteriaceae archaeon]